MEQGEQGAEPERVLETPLKGPAAQLHAGCDASPAPSAASWPSPTVASPAAADLAATELQAIRDGLEEAVCDVIKRYQKTLPKRGGDDSTVDRRVAELERFEFASAPLRQFNAKAVTAARAKLSRNLDKAFGESLKGWLTRQKDACEKTFLERLLRCVRCDKASREDAMCFLEQTCTEFEEVSSFVGGRVTGALRSGLHRKLTGRVRTAFPLPDSEQED